MHKIDESNDVMFDKKNDVGHFVTYNPRKAETYSRWRHSVPQRLIRSSDSTDFFSLASYFLRKRRTNVYPLLFNSCLCFIDLIQI